MKLKYFVFALIFIGIIMLATKLIMNGQDNMINSGGINEIENTSEPSASQPNEKNSEWDEEWEE